MVASSTVRISSRKSQLALVQTHWIQAELSKAHPNLQFDVVTMSTQGDKILDVPLAKIGDKGLFTKELEVSMLTKHSDLAVHSLKDLPTNLPEGLMLGAVTERENPADALVVHEKLKDKTLETLPSGTVVGTSSLRRLAQLRHYYPHLTFKDVRGNLNTRLQKLDSGEYDALILAAAGLQRLGMGDRVHEIIDAEISLHAVGQGALGIECRAEDPEILALFAPISHYPTTQRCLAERSFLRELEGGCQVPIGVNTSINADQLTLKGIVASLDGKTLIKGEVTGDLTKPDAIGLELAHQLKDKGAQDILNKIFAEVRS
ncbi:MAG: hydroxymethylbilane synthase [Pseudanabaena sp. Salubria-1]|jgi:hydroxymethylbilane synthase|nr:hydroxymethylbilane synthase [Pseudanabaena sp. Salubria-1]